MFGSTRPALCCGMLAAVLATSWCGLLFVLPDHTMLVWLVCRCFTALAHGTEQLAWQQAHKAMSVDAMFAPPNKDTWKVLQVCQQVLMFACLASHRLTRRLWVSKVPSWRWV